MNRGTIAAVILEKYQGFWPLPGGIQNFVGTLNRVLQFVRDNSPSEDQLVQWFFQNFDKVSPEGVARDYVRVTLRHSGLVDFNKPNHFLTKEGEQYLASPNNTTLYKILDDHVIGFHETLEVIASQEIDMEGIAKEVSRKTGMNWSATYGQPYVRVTWLRSLGVLSGEAGKYTLTAVGRDLLGQFLPPQQAQIPPHFEPRELSVVPVETILEMDIISKKLRETQHLAKEFGRFVEAIGEAFSFLRFLTEQLGKPGDTDVFATAHLKDASYSVVVDGKTTEAEKVTERQINWPALLEHKEKRKAKFAAIIAVSFAGGDLTDRARKFAITLLETETLIKLLEIHGRTPLNLEDLRRVFETKGPFKLEDSPELLAVIDQYDRRQKIVPQVLQGLYELQREGERTSAADIRWKLKKDFDQDEIEQALDLLEGWSFVKKLQTGEWTSLMSPKVVASRLKATADMLSHL